MFLSTTKGRSPIAMGKLRTYERSRCDEHGESCHSALRGVRAPPGVVMVAPPEVPRNASRTRSLGPRPTGRKARPRALSRPEPLRSDVRCTRYVCRHPAPLTRTRAPATAIVQRHPVGREEGTVGRASRARLSTPRQPTPLLSGTCLTSAGRPRLRGMLATEGTRPEGYPGPVEARYALSELRRIPILGTSVKRARASRLRPHPLPPLARAGRSLRRCLRCRPQTSEASATTVAPHQCGHDERPHRQQKEAHQLSDRRDEALVGHLHRTVVHERDAGNGGNQSHPARVDPTEGDGKPEEEEGQSRKEVGEAVHPYLCPPSHLSRSEGCWLLVSWGTYPGVYRVPEGYPIDGLQDRERGGRRHRSGEAEGCKPRT